MSKTTFEKAKSTVQNIRSNLKDIPYRDIIEDILVFGSCSKNQIRSNSDLDIAVVSSEPLSDEYRLSIEGFIFNYCELELDLIFVTKEQLESKDKYRIYYYIKKDGRSIWN